MGTAQAAIDDAVRRCPATLGALEVDYRPLFFDRRRRLEHAYALHPRGSGNVIGWRKRFCHRGKLSQIGVFYRTAATIGHLDVPPENTRAGIKCPAKNRPTARFLPSVRQRCIPNFLQKELDEGKARPRSRFVRGRSQNGLTSTQDRVVSSFLVGGRSPSTRKKVIRSVAGSPGFPPRKWGTPSGKDVVTGQGVCYTLFGCGLLPNNRLLKRGGR